MVPSSSSSSRTLPPSTGGSLVADTNGRLLEDFWKTFGRLGRLLEDFWKTLEDFWKTFGRLLEDFWKTWKTFGRLLEDLEDFWKTSFKN